MYTLTIRKNNIITHGPSQFNTEADLLSHLSLHQSMETYGKNEYSYESLVSPEIPEIKEIQIIEDEEQEVIVQEFQAAVYETVVTPPDFTVEILDITEELALEAEKKAAQEFLNSTDWKILKYLRHKALGRTPSMSEEEYLELEEQRQLAADKL